MKEMTDRELALAALGASPEAANIAARVTAGLRRGAVQRARPRAVSSFLNVQRWPRAAAVVAAVALAANLVVVRLVPGYAQAVSHAPFVGALPAGLLRAAGLTEAQVSRVTVTSTSSGHTLTLLAASADSARTVLLVQVDGKDSIPSKEAAGYIVFGTLTDQYGRTYDGVGGAGGDLWFKPLTGRAIQGPVEVTLRVRSILMWPATPPGTTSRPPALHGGEVSGDWAVATTVTLRPGRPVPLPAPKTVGPATYTVTSIRLSGTQVTVDYKVTGDPREAALYGQLKTRGWPQGNGDPGATGIYSFLRAWIVRSDGSDATVPGNTDNAGWGLDSEHLASGTVQRVLPGPGDYLLRIGDPTAVEFPIHVP